MRAGLMMLTLALSLGSAALAQRERRLPAEIAENVIRAVEVDAALPADAEEYQATGKNAVLMLESRTAVSTELPLRAAYLMYRNVRIPLQRLAIGPKKETSDGQTHQVSFYLIPIHYMRLNTRLIADFRGNRTGFSITSYSPAGTSSYPAFARLDEYDMPEDPNTTAVARLVAREYPDQARTLEH